MDARSLRLSHQPHENGSREIVVYIWSGWNLLAGVWPGSLTFEANRADQSGRGGITVSTMKCDSLLWNDSRFACVGRWVRLRSYDKCNATKKNKDIKNEE